LGQRDQVRQKTDAIQKKLSAERGQLNRVRNEARNRPVLTPEQKSSVQALRRDNRGVRTDLNELADFAAQTPALRPIADTAERVAGNEMPKADEALSRAQRKDTDAPRREEQLKQADEELARAQKQLDALRQENEKLAQSRLDQLRMEQLAARQQQLARRANELAAKNLTQDPAARQELEAGRAQQGPPAQGPRRPGAAAPAGRE